MSRPSGDTFALARDGEGVAALVERLRTAIPQLIVLEATGASSKWRRRKLPLPEAGSAVGQSHPGQRASRLLPRRGG
jgi:hypothetical protein